MNIISGLEEEEVMLKFRKIKAYAFIEALLALMIATLTVLLLSFVLGDSVKREQQHKCVLNEYSNQLMKLHESRPPVSYPEETTINSTSKTKNKNSSNNDSTKQSDHKMKEAIHLKKIDSKTPVTSVNIHCSKEEVIQIERKGPTKKVSISAN